MRLEHYSEEQLKQQIRDIVYTYLDKTKFKIFIFGSRVTGKDSEYSDIDVGIEGDEQIPYTIMANIKDDIDAIPVLYIIDIVDFSKTSEDFKHVALQNIEYIYG